MDDKTVGIYNESFISFLEEALDDVKISGNEIIIPCPWCELDKKREHYHMYISLDAPVFHCFMVDCHKSGFIDKLIKYLAGSDKKKTKDFINEEKLEEIKNDKPLLRHSSIDSKIKLPEISVSKYKLKDLYMKQRLGYNDVDYSKLDIVFSIREFVEMNNIKLKSNIQRMLDYLDYNFVGFLTKMGSKLICKNIDRKANIKTFKMNIFKTEIVDYCEIRGYNDFSKTIVIGEGIFDILSEYTFDNLNIRHNIRLYASTNGASYKSVIKSIGFIEQKFKLDLVILSDNDVKIKYYERLKKDVSHIINKFDVYYNKRGEDFGDIPVIPIKVNV